MRVSPAITNMTAGEWSPQMFGQIDLASYPNACKLMRNFVVRVHGGAQKRPGTIFVAESGGVGEVRLIPFQYSTEQAYVLELYIADDDSPLVHVYMDRGQVVAGSVPYNFGHPFTSDRLEGLGYTQDKDIMYLFHRENPITKLIRYDHDDWAAQAADITGGPLLPIPTSSETGTNLITNGEMEEDDHWDAVGTPIIIELDDTRIYKGTYSLKLVSLADSGIKSETFTTETGVTYIVRVRIYTSGDQIILKVHSGDASGGYILNATVDSIPHAEWTEITRLFTETAGGSAAQLEILSAVSGATIEYSSCYPSVYSEEGVKATSKNSTSYWPYYATNPGYSLTGTSSGTSWISASGSSTNQRFHIDLGAKKAITRIYYENYHTSGSNTTYGVKNFTLWGSNSVGSFNELDYATNTGWTQITTAETHFEQHSATNTVDPQYILITDGGLYQYYAFKFADGYGGAYIGFRRVELQTYSGGEEINIDNVEIYKKGSLTLTPSATTGEGITITASADLFEAGHVGAFFKLIHDENSGLVKITSITSSTVAVADVLSDLGSTDATDQWQEGAWSVKNGYPACGCFYEQRLMVASTDNDPDAVWGSKPTEYENFTPGVADTDPVAYKLQSDIIRWLAPMGQLVAGTVSAEYRLGGQSSDTGITPTSIRMTQQSRKGCANIAPIPLGGSLLFVQRRGESSNYGKKIRELSYNYMSDSYDGIDLSLFAEHITGTGFKRLAFMASPFPIMWGVTADGRLVGMTYEREQKVIAWHYHPMDGAVKDICVIPGANQDDLYLVVERTIDGETKKYIEVMADFDWGDDDDYCYFVDCGLSAEFSTPTTSITGLDHLEGETVAVLADGVVQAQKVVSGGAITLDTAASVVHVGLPYTSELQPLDLQGGSVEGTSQGKVKRIHGVALSLYKSMGGEIGQDDDTTERIFYHEETDATGAIELFSGIKDDFNFQGDWQNEGAIYIKHDDPLPFTVLSILPRFRTEDK